MTPEQKERNDSWLQDAGMITFLCPPERPTPPGLRKPYQYILPIAETKKLLEELKTAIKPFDKPKLQMGGAYKKGLSRGIRLNIFLLGYYPGACGNLNEGITKEDWETVTKNVYDILVKYLPDACPYIEDWRTERKFQFRFETYIAFQELLD